MSQIWWNHGVGGCYHKIGSIVPNLPVCLWLPLTMIKLSRATIFLFRYIFGDQQSWNLMKVSQFRKLLQTLWSSFQSSASVDVCTAGRKEMEHWCSLLTISLCYTAVHPPQETGNAKSNYFCLNFFNCSSWYLLHITLMLLAYRMVEYITETNIESQFFWIEINGQPYYHLHPPLPHPPPPPSPPFILKYLYSSGSHLKSRLKRHKLTQLAKQNFHCFPTR